MRRLGPVLQFLGCQGDCWGVSALLVGDDGDAAPVFEFARADLSATCTQAPVPGMATTAWRFDFAVPLTASAQGIDYFVDGQAFAFTLPAQAAMPDMAYVSCNGYSDARARKHQQAPNALWARMARLHGGQEQVGDTRYGPLHLLLHGGDQIYSDDMWAALPELRAWTERDWFQRCQAPLTDSLRTELQALFARWYVERWSQPEVAWMLARVPSVMMWDDHDILDGWGSHLAQLHDSPVFQGIFAIARAAFELFQRQMMGALPPATLPGQSAHHSAYRIGPAGLLVLDMRSERRPGPDGGRPGMDLRSGQVIGAESWRAIYAWLDANAGSGMRHLFVMASIPVMHPSFETLRRLLGVFLGQQELEDDLRDHWTSPAHRAERLRLIHRLLGASAAGTRVTVLSGDVHVAATGIIEATTASASGRAGLIEQLTSSGVEHPPPAGVSLPFLEQAGLEVEAIDPGITGRMAAFPGTQRRVIGRRNFMTLQADAPGRGERYWVNWWAEGEAHPYTKVIAPIASS